MMTLNGPGTMQSLWTSSMQPLQPSCSQRDVVQRSRTPKNTNNVPLWSLFDGKQTWDSTLNDCVNEQEVSFVYIVHCASFNSAVIDNLYGHLFSCLLLNCTFIFSVPLCCMNFRLKPNFLNVILTEYVHCIMWSKISVWENTGIISVILFMIVCNFSKYIDDDNDDDKRMSSIQSILSLISGQDKILGLTLFVNSKLYIRTLFREIPAHSPTLIFCFDFGLK